MDYISDPGQSPSSDTRLCNFGSLLLTRQSKQILCDDGRKMNDVDHAMKFQTPQVPCIFRSPVSYQVPKLSSHGGGDR